MTFGDAVNGAFEAGAAVALWRNCWLIWRDREVRGVSVASTAFFAAWGFWNLWYYRSLGQSFSWAAGMAVVLANTCWVSLAVYFRRKR